MTDLLAALHESIKKWAAANDARDAKNKEATDDHLSVED